MKAFGTWVVSHGVMRGWLKQGSRSGDLIARLAFDPELRAYPFDAYEELRSRGNVVRGRYISAAVGHGAANTILRSDSFGVASGQAGLPKPLRRVMTALRDDMAVGAVEPPSLLATDGEQHSRMRKQVSRAFTARSVAGLEDRVAEVATRLLDDLAGTSAFDLVDYYASQLPLAVIADLLGVPQHERAQLLSWGNLAATQLDPGLTWHQFRDARAAVRSMNEWFVGHIERLRANPGDDLMSRLATQAGPDQLDELELRGVGLLVLGAGFETTVSLLSNGVALLDQHPEQLQLLRDAPERWPNAVEEVFRYDSPVQLTIREAYETTTLDDVEIKKGEAVLVVLGAANRDPAVFEEPQRFDVTRTNAHEHLALSAGAHFCLGASLARMEGAVGLRLLYERFPSWLSAVLRRAAARGCCGAMRSFRSEWVSSPVGAEADVAKRRWVNGTLLLSAGRRHHDFVNRVPPSAPAPTAGHSACRRTAHAVGPFDSARSADVRTTPLRSDHAGRGATARPGECR